jgi:hypothetical protein
MYDSPTGVREGKVVSWHQWNTGPFCPITFWGLSIEMDSFGPGDTVQIQGLKAAKQHNGEKGTIIEFVESEGRFKVKLNDRKKNSFVAIKPENLETTVTSYTVNRMNVEGGGTLKREGSDHLISLEWIDPVEPVIDLDEGVLKALCPTCRSKEPPCAAYNDAETQKEDECPASLEKKSCRVLQCGHSVCHDCWKQWSNTSTTISVTEPQISPQELLAKRKENYDKLQAIMTTVLGENKPSEPLETTLNNLTNDLMEDSKKEDQECLSDFWRKAKTIPSQLLCFTQVVKYLGNHDSCTRGTIR